MMTDESGDDNRNELTSEWGGESSPAAFCCGRNLEFYGLYNVAM